MLADCSVEGREPRALGARGGGARPSDGTRAVVVAEANQGGAMVESVLQGGRRAGCRCGWSMPARARWRGPSRWRCGSRPGGRSSAGTFPELEAELAGLSAGGGYEGPGRSPDRADAMVWAMTELGETRSGVPRVRML